MKFGQRVHAEQNQQKNLKKPRSPKSTAKTLGGRSTLEAVHVDAVPIVSQATKKKSAILHRSGHFVYNLTSETKRQIRLPALEPRKLFEDQSSTRRLRTG